MSQDLIAKLANAFKPVPLPADSPLYVDLKEVRGDADVWRDLGIKILRAELEDYTCQLYAGHRGGGKSTELLRLKKNLEDLRCFVVYFAADEKDIDIEDTQYTDILIACTRHLLESFQKDNSAPLQNWLRERWKDLTDLALTEVKIEDPKLETGKLIEYFGKLSATIRTIPSERQKIRDKLNPHTVTLIQALNEFIVDIKNSEDFKKNYSKLVVIVDNLDRIVPVPRDENKTNYDEIFLDRANQLKGLKCHIIYTIPISMVYSTKEAHLRETYDNNHMVLPMIMINNPNGSINQEGLAGIRAIIEKRTGQIAPELKLESEIFESAEVLEKLCLMTGGHVRNLMLYIGTTFNFINVLPITAKALQSAITQERIVYKRTVEDEDWQILANVHASKSIKNDTPHLQLLFSRCILEYAYFDEENELQNWYDVHPLILNIKEFKEAMTVIEESKKNNVH